MFRPTDVTRSHSFGDGDAVFQNEALATGTGGRELFALGHCHTVEVWQEGDWEWLQVFITRIFPGPDGPMTAIAVEPMTAPADALNSGLGLRWIDPGASWSGHWGICRPA